ncbi:MAG: ribonuclease P protein component [Phycisphaerales bacterium]|nr:ribonuclease P protein component [Phycisphaerales bacterium]
MSALTFRPKHRLTHARQFAAAYGAKTQRAGGPLVIFSRPNDLGHPRLGLSVGRRVGNAITRNRVKRLLREAFRHLQHELPPLDLVINVRPHEPRDLDAYTHLLRDLAVRLAADWERRGGGRADA